MKRVSLRRLAAIAVIVTTASGCDNVVWEGVEVRLEAPDPPPGSLEADSTVVVEPGLPPLPEGPVVYLVRRDGSSASAFALASREGGRMVALPAEEDHPGFTEHFVRSLLPPEQELILFADGARVGTFVAGDTFSSDRSYCAARPRVDGVLELVPGAADPGFYMAVPAAEASGIPRGRWAPPESTAEIRTASLNLAGELMNRFRSPWPQSPVATLRRDLTTITPPAPVDLEAEAPLPHFATTFVHEDGLRVGETGRNAWSLFYVARYDGTSYHPTLVHYRLFERDGKATPRLVAWSDLTGDGQEEMVLEVLGTRNRWLALAGYQDGEWQFLMEDACEAPPSASEDVGPGGE